MFKFGKTEVSMRANGKTIKQTVKVDLSIKMVMSMKVYGEMTKRPEKEYTRILMVRTIQVTG